MEREDGLERCLRQLVESPELQVPLSEDTQRIIRESRMLIASESNRATYDELCNTVVYIGEQVENLRITFEQLVGEMVEIRKRLPKEVDRQGKAACQKAEDLLQWIKRGGFPPDGTGVKSFDRLVAMKACEAVLWMEIV